MFEFEGKCIVRRIEADRAVSNDAASKARVKVNIPELSLEAVAGALICKPEALAGFFNNDNPDEPLTVFKGLKKIVCTETWEDMHSVKISTLRKVQVSQVRVVDLTPAPGGFFNANMIVLFENPAENFLEILADRCNREVNIVITQTEADQADLLDGSASAPKPTKQTEFPDLPTKPTTAKPRGRPKKEAGKPRKDLN